MTAAIGAIAHSPIATTVLLVEELNHRVMNQYALAIASIRLAATKIDSGEARAALNEVAERLHGQALAHKALMPPAASQPVDLGEYLAGFCHSFAVAVLEERGVHLALACEPIAVDSARCWRVGLVIAELITNALRHGLKGLGSGHIGVSFVRTGAAVACTVRDDGVGADAAVLAGGLRVARGLAAELGGQLACGASRCGTWVRLTFPYQSDLDF